jgi:hypothetical protein
MEVSTNEKFLKNKYRLDLGELIYSIISFSNKINKEDYWPVFSIPNVGKEKE